jgi:enoyl-CoA hydratase/carnithine racemase
MTKPEEASVADPVPAYAGGYVRVDVDPETRVGTLRLHRPRVNALDETAWRELGEAVDVIARADVGAGVLWGGPHVFAAGADIRQLQALSVAGIREFLTIAQESVSRLEALPQVTIAAINGYALGGGCEIALAADFRFAAQDAILGLPEIRLGLFPGAGGTQRLGRLVGLSRAKDLVLTGRDVTADEALEIGMVDRVLPAEQVLQEARDAAAGFAAGPYALRLAKQALNSAADLPLADGLRLERSLVAESFASADLAVGLGSFLAHGPGRARFAGR